MIDFSNITTFDSYIMLREAEKIKSLIYEDARKGIMQDGKTGLQYRDKKYVNKKSKGMYPNQLSRNTAFVDMTLTGDMWDRIEFNADENESTMNYNSSDYNKIDKNEKLGRVISTLSDENFESITDDIYNLIISNIEQSNDVEEIIIGIPL